MKFALVAFLLSFITMAETYEYKIDGMSCAGCKNMIKSVVCPIQGIKDCQVEIGSMKLTSQEGTTLDQAAISKALDDLNKKNKEEYKISSSKKVDETTPTQPTTKKAKK